MRIDSQATDPALTTSGTTPSRATPKDEFLKLLVAQLEHQDPLEPQKGSEFVAQLAQIAQVEQAAEINQRLGAITAGQDAAARAALGGMIGKTVTARTDTIKLAESPTAPPDMSVHLSGAASKVQVSIVDASGQTVRRFDLGPRGSGDAPLAWDGRDDKGAPVAPGSYRVEIQATSSDGGAVEAFCQLRGTVSSLQFEGGTSRFRIGPFTVAPADIVALGI
jgi:flagellar basal-body rod modification protein FlgD